MDFCRSSAKKAVCDGYVLDAVCSGLSARALYSGGSRGYRVCFTEIQGSLPGGGRYLLLTLKLGTAKPQNKRKSGAAANKPILTQTLEL